MGLRLTYGGRTFWCGTWLGGCGNRLMTKIGKRKVPHFAHYPEMVGECRRRNLDETSADHLFIHRDLKTWLGDQGIDIRRPRLLGDIKRSNGGTGSSRSGGSPGASRGAGRCGRWS
ncbi:competence protein CoiA family protein [Actinomadura decatromicini]